MPVLAPVDPAQTPTEQEADPPQGGDEQYGEGTQPVTPVQPPVMSSPTTTVPRMPQSSASDDAPLPAGPAEAEPESGSLSMAGEAESIGAMSAAEAAVRQRAEADYQRAIEHAIAAAAWRTDDDGYGNLVRDLVRSRQVAGFGIRGGFDTRAAGASGDMAQPSLGWDRYGVVRYGAFDGSSGSFGAASRLPPVGLEDERTGFEQVRFGGARPWQGPSGGAAPRPYGMPDYEGTAKLPEKLWESLPDYEDLPPIGLFPFGPLYNKPPKDAKDPNGPKAPGKPSEKNGFRDPKGGERWVKNPNSKNKGSHGWLDDKGRVWIPTGPRGSRAHGRPHWDVQLPKGKYVNVEPDEHIDDKLREKGL